MRILQVFLLIISSFTFSQNSCELIVVDIDNNLIEDVRVYYKNNYQTSTDNKGIFVINTTQKIFTLSKVGFQELSVNDYICGDIIILNNYVTDLEPIYLNSTLDEPFDKEELNKIYKSTKKEGLYEMFKNKSLKNSLNIDNDTLHYLSNNFYSVEGEGYFIEDTTNIVKHFKHLKTKDGFSTNIYSYNKVDFALDIFYAGKNRTMIYSPELKNILENFEDYIFSKETMLGKSTVIFSPKKKNNSLYRGYFIYDLKDYGIYKALYERYPKDLVKSTYVKGEKKSKFTYEMNYEKVFIVNSKCVDTYVTEYINFVSHEKVTKGKLKGKLIKHNVQIGAINNIFSPSSFNFEMFSYEIKN
jgi:hypothetical protein